MHALSAASNGKESPHASASAQPNATDNASLNVEQHPKQPQPQTKNNNTNEKDTDNASSDATEEQSAKLSSVIGLESMIEERREAGELTTNAVRIEVPFGRPIEEVYSGVHDGEILGSGISSVVRLATHKATGIKYAVKCMDLGLVNSSEGLRQLREEIFIMCQLDHPNIVRLEEVYESHK
jgi:hypothetical protein